MACFRLGITKLPKRLTREKRQGNDGRLGIRISAVQLVDPAVLTHDAERLTIGECPRDATRRILSKARRIMKSPIMRSELLWRIRGLPRVRSHC